MEYVMGSRPDALYSAVFNDVVGFLSTPPVGDGYYPPDASYLDVASRLLLNGLLKKFIPVDSAPADNIAREKFLTSNKKCETWALSHEGSWDETLLGETKRVIYDFLHADGRPIFESYSEILDNARCGPGASIGSKFNSFYAKMFSSRLTTTSLDLYMMYRSYCSNYPLFLEAEIHRCERYGLCSIVDGSRTSLVPKTVKESRLICTEPSLNMFFQLGLGSILEGRLKSFFGIDLSSQPFKNQRLAKIGSLGDQYSTIDLSSASDSISLKLCKELFPSWFFETLMEIRSPLTEFCGETLSLNMISTMGNGFTFPLQTIIFSSIILAAYRIIGLPIIRPGQGQDGNFGCFGDDLICHKESFPYVIRLLKLLGFTPNPAKTFSEGPFRESCGADWFLSQPVRAVYIRKLSTLQDIFVAINLLNEWSAKTGIALVSAIRYLLSLIGRGKLLYVPFFENNDAGVRVPSFILPNNIRYNSNNSILYRRYQVLPRVIKISDRDIHIPRGIGKLEYNPSGLLLSFLYGEIKNGMFTIRQTDVRRYRPRLGCTPFWDYCPIPTENNGTSVEWGRWETALLINFSTP